MSELAPGETVEDRPFASPSWTRTDEAILERMWARLRAYAGMFRELAGKAPATARRSANDRSDKLVDADGSVHTIVLPNVRRALRSDDLFAVGFFGQARTGVDHTPIMLLEAELIADMWRTEGLVAYYNAFYPEAGWGNLVLFADAAAEAAWGGDRRHAEAVRRSPDHYHSIRLHHARASGGFLGTGSIEITRTRYLDYGAERPWRAVRERT
ncbi:MAG TPA: hypothetical protein VK867_03115 [Candidatus Limnocylindrales bacterium]|nr:hypothetical protein [Candidatus Limnocylindrales bacterium]